MPTWGDSQRYSVDYSNTMWGSDINFIMQAQDVWIRTLYDRHRFVVRGNLGWIEADNFDKVPPDLRFFAGGDRSIRGYKYKSISPKDDDGKLIGASKLAPARWSISTTSAANGGARCLSIAAKRSAISARAI
jgi:translocation and assembly module TamA